MKGKKMGVESIGGGQVKNAINNLRNAQQTMSDMSAQGQQVIDNAKNGIKKMSHKELWITAIIGFIVGLPIVISSFKSEKKKQAEQDNLKTNVQGDTLKLSK